MNASLEARLNHALDELAAIKKELAVLEAAFCQCHPQREHDYYRRPATYLHAADCPVAGAQQAGHAHH